MKKGQLVLPEGDRTTDRSTDRSIRRRKKATWMGCWEGPSTRQGRGHLGGSSWVVSLGLPALLCRPPGPAPWVLRCGSLIGPRPVGSLTQSDAGQGGEPTDRSFEPPCKSTRQSRAQDGVRSGSDAPTRPSYCTRPCTTAGTTKNNRGGGGVQMAVTCSLERSQVEIAQRFAAWSFRPLVLGHRDKDGQPRSGSCDGMSHWIEMFLLTCVPDELLETNTYRSMATLSCALTRPNFSEA